MGLCIPVVDRLNRCDHDGQMGRKGEMRCAVVFVCGLLEGHGIAVNGECAHSVL